MQAIEFKVSNSDLLRAGGEREARMLIWNIGIGLGIPWELSTCMTSLRVLQGELLVAEDIENDALCVRWTPEEPVVHMEWHVTPRSALTVAAVLCALGYAVHLALL